MIKYSILIVLFSCLTACKDKIVSQNQPQETEFNLPISHYQQISLQSQMKKEGFALGSKSFLRVFKEERVLEAWLLKPDGRYHLYRKFPICTYSGSLGPKLKEGDRQSPEGFYSVARSQLNPNSNYHLSFNLGYPNAYDRAHGYTGSYLMVHGNCVSIGCYAMDDKQIESIYSIVSASLQKGQRYVPVHIFPFKMTHQNMQRHVDNQWQPFWQMLQPAYDYFEHEHIPPNVTVRAGRYQTTPPMNDAALGVSGVR